MPFADSCLRIRLWTCKIKISCPFPLLKGPLHIYVLLNSTEISYMWFSFGLLGINFPFCRFQSFVLSLLIAIFRVLIEFFKAEDDFIIDWTFPGASSLWIDGILLILKYICFQNLTGFPIIFDDIINVRKRFDFADDHLWLYWCKEVKDLLVHGQSWSEKAKHGNEKQGN
jgi:hypothetical protein